MLVASTDGVGTKVELAARLGRYRGVGADIVNHCINDVLVQGARPLFFLDYVASSTLHAERVAEVVTGMAEACAASGCALLGGETAEMPGVYAEDAFDIAGTLIGLVGADAAAAGVGVHDQVDLDTRLRPRGVGVGQGEADHVEPEPGCERRLAGEATEEPRVEARRHRHPACPCPLQD